LKAREEKRKINTEKEFENLLFSSLRYQLKTFQIKLIRFNCLTLKHKEKVREDKKKNKER
jgi:hypothetical protein